MTIQATTMGTMATDVLADVASKPKSGNEERRREAEKYCLTLPQVMTCKGLADRLNRPEFRHEMTALHCTPEELVNVKNGLVLLGQFLQRSVETIYAKDAGTLNRLETADPRPIVVVLDAEKLSSAHQTELTQVMRGEALLVLLLVHHDPGELLRNDTWIKSFRDRVFTTQWPVTTKDAPTTSRGRLANSEVRKHFNVGVEAAARDLGIELIPVLPTAHEFVDSCKFKKDQADTIVDLGKRALCRAIAKSLKHGEERELDASDVMGVMMTPYSEIFPLAQKELQIRSAGTDAKQQS